MTATAPIFDEPSRNRDHAVVIGGSIAGLLTARVLADHFARVTILERDRLPAGPDFRKGVPQARHMHALLARGMEVINHLLPGMEDELIADGAVPVDWPKDALWLTAAGWSGRFDTGLRLISCSREFLEWHVGRRVAAISTIRIVQGCDVTGLLSGADGTAVEGVSLRPRPSAADADVGEELRAALVVDASGRNSHAPEWLEAIGYERPAVEQIDACSGYASRYYAIPETFSADWKLLYLTAKAPEITRLGLIFPVEGNRWRVSLWGASRDYPPTDDDGFLAFARGLRSPLLYEAIKGAEPLTPIHGFQQTQNQRRFYEKLTRLPEGFLVTGDALCAFNPIYGQGMTAAAQGAFVLAGLLRSRGGAVAGIGREFHREVAKANSGAWLVASGEDLRFPATVGGNRTLQTRLTHRYLDRVLRVATEDPAVSLAFLNVVQLVAPPTSLFKPGVLLPALVRGGAPPITAPPVASGQATRSRDPADSLAGVTAS